MFSVKFRVHVQVQPNVPNKEYFPNFMKNLWVGTLVKDRQHCRVAFTVLFLTGISKFCRWAMIMYYKVNTSM